MHLRMLVDFLKGNHLSKILATVMWLWVAKGPAYLGTRAVAKGVSQLLSVAFIWGPRGQSLWVPAFSEAGKGEAGQP